MDSIGTIIPRLHDEAIIKQISSNRSTRRARVFWMHLLDDCSMFAWSCKRNIKHWLRSLLNFTFTQWPLTAILDYIFYCGHAGSFGPGWSWYRTVHMVQTQPSYSGATTAIYRLVLDRACRP